MIVAERHHEFVPPESQLKTVMPGRENHVDAEAYPIRNTK